MVLHLDDNGTLPRAVGYVSTEGKHIEARLLGFLHGEQIGLYLPVAALTEGACLRLLLECLFQLRDVSALDGERLHHLLHLPCLLVSVHHRRKRAVPQRGI